MPDNAILDERDIRKDMMRVTIPPCAECTHWDVGEETCEAFPAGIPDAIFRYGNPHKKPFPGDGGIRFEPIERKDE